MLKFVEQEAPKNLFRITINGYFGDCDGNWKTAGTVKDSPENRQLIEKLIEALKETDADDQESNNIVNDICEELDDGSLDYDLRVEWDEFCDRDGTVEGWEVLYYDKDGNLFDVMLEDEEGEEDDI